MKTLILIAVFIFGGNYLFANNLQIGAATLTNSGGSQYLNFTISWENSWRTSSAPFNWDAVWVFVKRRDCAGLQWHHVNVAPQDSAHSGGSTLFVDAYADKKGVMIYRAADGSGNISATNIKLKLDSVPAGNYDYEVFGIEMVYIPQGSFYVGDGGSNNTFIMSSNTSNLLPYLITGEQQILIGSDSSKLFCTLSGLFDGTTLPAEYPKGYNSFYCMKYEISQGQYADFLNNIAQDAFNNRNPAAYGTYRYSIQGIWPQMQSTTPDRACNHLSFQDLTAYLDWSALSPMTEFEFEKVCRGANTVSVTFEKAWGTETAVRSNNITAGTDGTPAEGVTDSIPPGTGIANYAEGSYGFEGVLRCGFAAKANTNRYKSGATYYGIMEMSGNVAERCYNPIVTNTSPGANDGGAFTGQHGDGELSTTPNAGFANEGWPHSAYSGSYNEYYGVATRGGGWLSPILRLNVSDRAYSFAYSGPGSQSRSGENGGRGVSRRQQ